MSQNCNPRGRAGGAVLECRHGDATLGSTNTKSFNTLKIRFALAEIGVPYEFQPVDLAKGESRTPDFKRLNPHGKVPVLQDGDFALPESDAILVPGREVSRREPAAPAGRRRGLQARAQILRFLDIASTAFYPAYSDWWTATNSDDPAKRSDVAADSALVKVKRALDVLEATLASGEHLGGWLFARRRGERIDRVCAEAQVAARPDRRRRTRPRLVSAGDSATDLAIRRQR